MADETPKAEEKKISKRGLRGVVVSDKMKDTIVVSVSRFVKHPKYKKYMKKNKNYHVYDKGNTKEVGDKVEIVECAPRSKRTHFEVAG